MESRFERRKSFFRIAFFEGMAKEFHDVEIFYSRYYDYNSFQLALTEITRPEFKSSIIYIAGHGDGKTVSGANIKKIFKDCSIKSRKINATGVVIGSCFSAGTAKSPLDGEIASMIHDSQLSWAAAYTCASNWFVSTMIDCALIRQMIRATARKLSCKESIAAELAAAISPFSPTHELGGDSVESDSDENPVQLRDGLVFFAQSDGQGYKAQEITDEVWVKWREWQLEEIGQPEE